MDRVIVYPGAIPLETDILNSERNALIGIGALAAALFGSSTTANGLTVSPTAPASMAVSIGPGQIYAVENVDDSAYSSLAADTAHQIVKQGVSLDMVTLACAAPATVGNSINYLIEATFQEQDVNPVLLPYYNSSDPTQAYSGPANSGASQPTTRKGSVVVTAKPGVAAATGSQTTPAADTGYIGLCVVTVPYGATSITAGMISPVSSAPIVPAGGILAAIRAIAYASRAETAAGTLTTKGVTPDGLAQAVQSGSFLYAAATGTANALLVAMTPAPAALIAGMAIVVKVATTNTGAATLNLGNFGGSPITSYGSPVRAGMLVAGQLYALIYDGANWQLQAPTMSGIVSFSYSATRNWELYSNGKVEQWGIDAIPGASVSTSSIPITFPIAFPTACTFAGGNPDNGASTSWGALLLEFKNVTTTTMLIDIDTGNTSNPISGSYSNARWYVKGY